jgi:isocitrate dehydrogenase
VPHWTQPIVIGRDAYGDVYRAVKMKVPGVGTVTISYQPADGGPVQSLEVNEFSEGGGVAMPMHNARVSIEDSPAPATTMPRCEAGRCISPPRIPS